MVRKLLCVLMVALLLVSAAVAEETAPSMFGYEEYSALMDSCRASMPTVADCVALLQPTHYLYTCEGGEGEPGATLLTFVSSNGEYDVRVETRAFTSDYGDSESLPDFLLSFPAYPTGVRWSYNAFPIPPIRGIALGDTKDALLSSFAYPEREVYTPTGEDMRIFTAELYRLPGEDATLPGGIFPGGMIIDLRQSKAETAMEIGFSQDYFINYTAIHTKEDGKRQYVVLSYGIEKNLVTEMSLMLVGEDE